MSGPKYKLVMRGADGNRRILHYDPHQSTLVWDDDGTTPNVRHLGWNPEPRTFDAIIPISPDLPGRKANITTLKIQLGLKCNYACTGCVQAHQPHDLQGSIDDAERFVETIREWFDGGPKGDGTGVKIEAWGGEPLVYWKVLRLVFGRLRGNYPHAQFSLITNGSLLTDEIIDWLDVNRFYVSVSHDGPAYEKQRPLIGGGKADPLDNPAQKAMILKLYDRLLPLNRFSFNCTITRKAYSYKEIRNYIADKLGVHPDELPLDTEHIMTPYDAGGLLLMPYRDEQMAMFETVFWEAVASESMNVRGVHQKIKGFWESIVFQLPAHALGQKCGMDRPDQLAVDLLGNVLTCQNTSADTRHKIGHVSNLEGVRLNTSYHWTKRKECRSCPVVQLCQGSCMFLPEDSTLWKEACDAAFSYNLALFAAALYHGTGYLLESITGPLREEALSTMTVISEGNPNVERYLAKAA